MPTTKPPNTTATLTHKKDTNMLPNITIEGRAVNDPELRFTPSGAAVANFRIACSESKKLDDGTWEDGDKLFVNVAIWKDAAEKVAELIHKGDKVTVTGRLYQREYETGSGDKRTSLELKFGTVSLPIDVRKDASSARTQAPAADPWSTAPVSDDNPPF